MRDKEEIEEEIERMEKEVGMPDELNQPQAELNLGYWIALKWVMEED